MEESPCWEANNHSCSQKIPRLLWNREGSLSSSQEPAAGPYREPNASSPQLPTLQNNRNGFSLFFVFIVHTFAHNEKFALSTDDSKWLHKAESFLII